MNAFRLTLLATLLCAAGFAQADRRSASSRHRPASPPSSACRRRTPWRCPAEIGGQKIEYIVLDDASDPTNAVTNVKKLLSDTRSMR